MYVWQQAEGARHARDAYTHNTLPAGTVFRTCCGVTLTVRDCDEHGPGKPGWLDPTCPECDRVIRNRLGIPFLSGARPGQKADA